MGGDPRPDREMETWEEVNNLICKKENMVRYRITGWWGILA